MESCSQGKFCQIIEELIYQQMFKIITMTEKQLDRKCKRKLQIYRFFYFHSILGTQ